MMGKCNHEKLMRISDFRLKCEKCGTTWTWNPILKVYSSTFVGIFKYLKEVNDEK